VRHEADRLQPGADAEQSGRVRTDVPRIVLGSRLATEAVGHRHDPLTKRRIGLQERAHRAVLRSDVDGRPGVENRVGQVGGVYAAQVVAVLGPVPGVGGPTSSSCTPTGGRSGRRGSDPDGDRRFLELMEAWQAGEVSATLDDVIEHARSFGVLLAADLVPGGPDRADAATDLRN
jgi:hypothetical protein